MKPAEGRRDLLEIVSVLAAWAAAIIAIHPRGNFPLDDDWDFAIAAFRFARSGHFHFTQFTAVSLRAQVLWGALSVRFFGESFDALRHSTLILSALTIVVINRTLARAPIGRGPRIIATLAFLVHPIFLWSSCTFMTEVPFVFASACALYFFLCGLEEEQLGFVIAGCVAVMVSWWVRQNGVAMLGAPLALLLIGRERLTLRWRTFVIPIATTMAIFGALLIFRRDLISGSPAMFATHFHMWQESTFRLPEQIALLFHYTVFNAQNSAFFFLPLSLPLLALLFPPRVARRAAIVLLIVAIPIVWRVADLAYDGYLMPYAVHVQHSDILPGPIVHDFGIGPPNLTDVFSLGYDYPFALPVVLRVGLTYLCAVLAALLLWVVGLELWRALHDPRKHLFTLLAAMAAIAGTSALFASGYYYDRYSFDSAWPMVLLLPLLIPWQRRATYVLAAVALIVIGCVSILGTQEYFRWNQARWSAFTTLRARAIPVDQIDAGPEIYAFYELADATVAKARRRHPPRHWLLAFHAVSGYRVVATTPFEGYGGLHQGTIYTLERIR